MRRRVYSSPNLQALEHWKKNNEEKKINDVKKEDKEKESFKDIQKQLIERIKPTNDLKEEIQQKLRKDIKLHKSYRVTLCSFLKTINGECVLCKDSYEAAKHFKSIDPMSRPVIITLKQFSLDMLHNEQYYQIAIRYIKCLQELKYTYLIAKNVVNLEIPTTTTKNEEADDKQNIISFYYALIVDLALSNVKTLTLLTKKRKNMTRQDLTFSIGNRTNK
jgi:hypothetical protein